MLSILPDLLSLRRCVRTPGLPRLPLAVLATTLVAPAQRPPDTVLTREDNRAVVEMTIRTIDKFYFSERVATQLDVGLRKHLDAGDYDKITSAFDLMDALDAHLLQISKDPHLNMRYSDEARPPVTEPGETLVPETPQEREESLQAARRRNFGFQRVEILDGNIGLLELNGFFRPEFAGETAGAAFTLLAGTDALILDLRSSQGGNADMVLFLASYFFPGDEQYRLGDWFTRVEGGLQQWWTLPYLPGKRYLGKDVFILTAKTTFSAPEGLTAFLQHHGKAIVVGEPTRGGTHPGVMLRVHPHFAVFVPVSMPIYPTGTPTFPLGRPFHRESVADEVGTGIRPDLEIAAVRARTRAHLEALQKQVAKHPEHQERLGTIVARLTADLAR